MPSLHEFITVDDVWGIVYYAVSVSLILFNTIVILRFFRDRKIKKNKIRTAEIKKLLLIHLVNPLQDLKFVLMKDLNDMKLLAEIVPEILKTLKGNSYQNLLDSLKGVGLYDWIKKNLVKKNKSKSIAAIRLAIHWPDEEIKNIVRKVVCEKKGLVQHAAVESLSHMKDIESFPIILDVFKQGKNFSFPLMCDVFLNFGKEASKELISIIKSPDVSVKVKEPALMAFGKIGDMKEIGEVAIPLCADENNDIRAFAFLALSNSGLSLPLALLEKGKNDEYWRVRQCVAECLGNAPSTPLEMLMELLGDENWLVGLQSGKALFKLGDKGKNVLKIISKKRSLSGQRAQMLLSERGE
jgi:HEAT repeat protein